MIKKYQHLASTRYLIRRLQTRFIMSEVRDRLYPVVVDIGVGRAPFKKYIQHDKYIGIDVEDRGGVPNVLIEDINEGLSLADNTADLVLITEVLEHVKKPAEVINELYRILKPGGKVVLTTPMTWFIHEAPNDFYRYTNFILEYFFRQAGFKIITVRHSNGFKYSLIALVVARLRKKIWTPVVLVLNAIGYIIHRHEQDRSLSLGQFVVAYKD